MSLSTLLTASTIVTALFAAVEINISSNTIISINGYDKTSNFLLGISAYAGIGPLTNDSYLKELNTNLGVNVIGYGQQLNGILPTSQSQAVSCCNTVNGLRNYIQDGKACKNFKNTYDPKIWNSNYMRQQTSITPFIYLKDSCQTGYEPEDTHCFGPDTGGGTPNNADGWWTELMVGFVNCTQQLDSNMKYYHIWNEPNAHFWKYNKNGTYYAEFYYNVTKAIKSHWPNTIISGPVTWCPPLDGNTWEDYYESLMQKVIKENDKSLLNYIDFHSYDNGNANLSAWDYTIASINAVSLYYRVATNGDNMRSHITETNVKLTDAQNDNKQVHWNFRTIENSKQILALSFNPDKFSMRHLFDLGADSFNFYKSIDYFMHDVIKPIQNGNMLQFKFTAYKDGYPRYDNGDGIQSQVVYGSDGTLTAVLVNYNNGNEEVKLTDLDKKVTWESKGRIATRYGVNNDLSVSVSGDAATVTLQPYSITAVSGKYGSNKPGQTMDLVEYRPNVIGDIMKVIGNSNANEDFSVDITIKNAPTGKNKAFAFIKFGLIGDALTDYKWNINVKIGSTSYLNKQGFTTKIQYNELGLSTNILDEIKDGTVVTLSFNGQRTRRRRLYYDNNKDDGNDEADVPGRFVFASLMVRYL